MSPNWVRSAVSCLLSEVRSVPRAAWAEVSLQRRGDRVE